MTKNNKNLNYNSDFIYTAELLDKEIPHHKILEMLKNGNIIDIEAKVKLFGEEKVADKLGIGVPTLKDIIKELLRPGRDPRDELPAPVLRTDVMEMSDLKPGMEMTGTVRNVTDFGAFIDIGVHQDGLVHISKITNKYIKHPSEVLKVGQIVKVWVIAVDAARGRISLTMLGAPKAEDK